MSAHDRERLQAAHESSSQRRAEPSRGGSALIDIRNMSAQLQAQARPAPSPEGAASGPAAVPLPSFAGSGLDGLLADPLVLAVPQREPPPPRAHGPLHALLAVLVVGVLGLGAIVILDDDPTPETLAAVPAPTRLVVGSAPAASEGEPPAAPGSDNDIRAGDPDQDDAAPSERPPEVERPAGPRRPRPRKPRTNPASATDQPASSPKPPTALDDQARVDCLLDGSLPQCKGLSANPAQPKPDTQPKPQPDPVELPSKLGQAEILAGISPVKRAAKTCGKGETVAIKFSVEGSTGAVLTATALDAHASSTIGACVAKAARKAQFANFSAPRQGFTFKFRL